MQRDDTDDEEFKQLSEESDAYQSSDEEEDPQTKSLQRIEPKVPKTFQEKQDMPRLILVLE